MWSSVNALTRQSWRPIERLPTDDAGIAACATKRWLDTRKTTEAVEPSRLFKALVPSKISSSKSTNDRIKEFFTPSSNCSEVRVVAHPADSVGDERTFFQVRVHFLLSIRGGPIAVVSIVHANVLLIADYSFLLSVVVVVVVVVIVVVFTHFPSALKFPIFDDFVPIFHVRSMSLHFVRAENNTRWRL